MTLEMQGNATPSLTLTRVKSMKSGTKNLGGQGEPRAQDCPFEGREL